MVNHDTLLDHLRNDFAIDLVWLRSYVTSWQQFVKIGRHTSKTTTCQCGVPQGSVLGHFLFPVYTSSIAEVMSRFGVQFHQFANDMHIYLALSDTNNNSFTRSLRASSLTEHNKSALTDHATQETVIDREPERFTRCIKEAIHIRKEGQQAMNRDEGSYQLLLLLVCVSFTIIGQPRNSVLIRRV